MLLFSSGQGNISYTGSFFIYLGMWDIIKISFESDLSQVEVFMFRSTSELMFVK